MSLRKWWLGHNSVSDILGDKQAKGLEGLVSELLMKYKKDLRAAIKEELMETLPAPYGEQAWKVVDEAL